MMRIIVIRDAQGHVYGFTVTGHALYARHGKDIICAAVSALTQTAVLGIRNITGIEPVTEVCTGRLSVRLPGEISAKKRKDVCLILEVMIAGLKEMAVNYPGFMKIREIKIRKI